MTPIADSLYYVGRSQQRERSSANSDFDACSGSAEESRMRRIVAGRITRVHWHRAAQTRVGDARPPIDTQAWCFAGSRLRLETGTWLRPAARSLGEASPSLRSANATAEHLIGSQRSMCVQWIRHRSSFEGCSLAPRSFRHAAKSSS